ncbi:hypothetical protein EC957_010106 [Mortierella hygrophila]|uniref:Myb-like domain-containing protein n=1 Tax=Mortierella hygrophila TaxID=979708 RepID=A0A9P6K8I1_9FUNG|nr:hypothetical protein EC957_010106 [Mortierella hygrophila]
MSRRYLDLSKLNWKKITRDVFGKLITPEHVQAHYAIAIRKTHKWTKAQVERLSEVVAAHTSATEGLTSETWERISSEFDNKHTPTECRTKWEALCHTNVNKSILSRSGNHWTKDEIRAYWRAWKQHGNAWDRISEAVRSSTVDGYKDKAVAMSTSSLADKSAEDCRVDFKHLVSVSIPMMDELEKEVGELALNLTHQPRKHWAWTTEQLAAMETAVRDITGVFTNLSQAMRNMTVNDWEKVAKKVDPQLTGDQCRYRWRLVDNLLPSLLTPDLKEPIPYPDHDTIFPGQRRRARLWTAEEVRGLEEAAESIRGLPRIPRNFTRKAREELKLDRTNIEIQKKTNEILGRSLKLLPKATGTSGDGGGSDPPAKAALSIFKIDPDTIAARRHSIILTGKRFRAETSPANKDGDEKDDDRDQQQIQIRPPTSTTAETETRTPILHLMWSRKDISKLTELVQKYGVSTLGWKQISSELSLPISKCQYRWRYMKRVAAASNKKK